MERLRYAVYTLEKDVVIQSHTFEKFRSVRLYVIVTSDLPAEVIFLVEKCISGGADCIQLRAKDVDDDTRFALAVEFVKICKEAGVVSIINDRIDIAAAAEADGVHLGQNDLPVAQARRLELAPLIIGKSTHSIEQLRAAFDERPTYVALGPVFTTATKPNATAVGLDYVRDGVQILTREGIGHVAVGGIMSGNVDQVLDAGVTCIAVCSAVTHAGDPTAACRELKRKISSYRGM
jgi:thiamine-phosphate pyrophosphorylase